ncbi:MAG: hypothetical protein Q9208_001479 [Pyrenodesmia sp. 3 TL-2023]
MAFGWSVSDIVLLSNLAWKTIQNTRNACGEHDELTSQLLTLHTVLRRLEHEISKPESPLNRPGDTSKEDVERIVTGCQKPLSLLNKVVAKYSLLSQEERSLKKLWLQVRFGNGEVVNTRDIRDKISSHASALTLYLNLVSTGSIGRIEKQMEDAGGDLKEVKKAVNNLTARLAIGPHSEGSVLTSRTDDDKAVWKEFRRSLLKEGFNSSFLKEHRSLIEAYFKELGDRGVLDNPQHSDETIGVAPAPDVVSDSPKQSNQATIREAQEVELQQKNQSRSGSPALEDTNHSRGSSSSVPVGTVNSSSLGSPPGGMAQKRDSVDHRVSLLPPGTGKSDISRDERRSPLKAWVGISVEESARNVSARNWEKWHRTNSLSMIMRSRKELHKLDRFFIASPWGICVIFHGIGPFDLRTDCEYRVIVLVERAYTPIRVLYGCYGQEFLTSTNAGPKVAESISCVVERQRAGVSEIARNAYSLTVGQDDHVLYYRTFIAVDCTDRTLEKRLSVVWDPVRVGMVDYLQLSFASVKTAQE